MYGIYPLYKWVYVKIVHNLLFFELFDNESPFLFINSFIVTPYTFICVYSYFPTIWYIKIWVIFFQFSYKRLPKFPPKFQQSLPYTGRSQVIDIYPVYTSNGSHLITQNHDPIILGLNPTPSHQHNTSYSITSYNAVQIKDSISTVNMHGQKGTKSFNH